jgi:hypothetical protein
MHIYIILSDYRPVLFVDIAIEDYSSWLLLLHT